MIFQFFSILGIAISLFRYAIYIKAIANKTTKPHPLTWLCSGLMGGIACVLQYRDHAGPSLWITAIVTIFCLGIGIVAIFCGEKRITKSDWFSFILALFIIPAWLMTKQPIAAMALIVAIELLTYFPTLRKSYFNPWEEDIISWSLSALRWVLATLAVSNITLGTIFYPAFIATCEGSIVLYFIWRRRHSARPIRSKRTSRRPSLTQPARNISIWRILSSRYSSPTALNPCDA